MIKAVHLLGTSLLAGQVRVDRIRPRQRRSRRRRQAADGLDHGASRGSQVRPAETDTNLLKLERSREAYLRLSYRAPIHAIGYGKSHDPSSLWLLSNHTAGSYTFVKEFCQSHLTRRN
jgi:hypothetical protein